MVRSRNISPEKYHAYRGREFEADILGEVEIRDPKFAEEVRKLVKDQKKPYIPYRQSLELAKKHQPADPTNPQKDFLRELRLAVAEKFGLGSDKELEQVGAYTAVGTPLDILHGVDGFISLKEPGKKEKIVTLDASLKKEKLEEGAKADVMVGDLPSPDENEAGYLARIDEIAREIADKMRAQEERMQ